MKVFVDAEILSRVPTALLNLPHSSSSIQHNFPLLANCILRVSIVKLHDTTASLLLGYWGSEISLKTFIAPIAIHSALSDTDSEPRTGHLWKSKRTETYVRHGTLLHQCGGFREASFSAYLFGQAYRYHVPLAVRSPTIKGFFSKLILTFSALRSVLSQNSIFMTNFVRLSRLWVSASIWWKLAQPASCCRGKSCDGSGPLG